ncbi:MAG: metallophosphoesterase family protein [Desulfobacteria bacterium]
MKELTWLHISDIHSCPKKNGWDAGDIHNKLETDIEKLKKDHGLSPHLIFVTGDIMFGVSDCGTLEEQYKKAAEFLKKLMDTCEVKLENIFLVPGNHDVYSTPHCQDQNGPKIR